MHRPFSATVVIATVVLATVVLPLAAADWCPLPLCRSWAKDPDVLPLPLGIGVTYYQQAQDYELTKLLVPPALLPPGAALDPSALAVENNVTQWSLKLDVWLLPCLNIFGLIGSIEGESLIDLTSTPIGAAVSRMSAEYEGLFYGLGAQVSWGYKALFGSLSAVGTNTELEESSSVSAFVLMPRVGLHNERGALWAGAMYQEVSEEHEGTMTVPFPDPVTGVIAPTPIPYVVELEDEDPWNLMVGMQIPVHRHLSFDLEVGFGERQHGQASVTCRF